MTKKLLPYITEHHTYVEPFGGGASLLFAKDPSPVEVYNDIDEGLVNFFRIIADPRTFRKFYHRVEVLPYTRAEYNRCRATWSNCKDPVERAVRWFVVARQSFSGSFATSWGSAVTASRRRMAQTCSKWLSVKDMLPEVSQRLRRVQIKQQDWRTILERYDTPETFFYLDPPYVASARRPKCSRAQNACGLKFEEREHKIITD